MAEEKNEEEKKEKKSGSNLVLIIIIILLVLILVGGGIAAYFLLSDNGNEPQANAATQTTQNNQAKMSKKKVVRNSDLLQIGPVYPLDQFIVNLLSQGGTRFLKTKMDLELSGPELTTELDKKKPLIRDIIIRTLSSKTFQEVSTSRGKEKLKDELVDKINAVLADGNVKNIFFTEFVVQ